MKKKNVHTTQSKIEDETVALLNYMPTRNGYKFVFWIDSEDYDNRFSPEDEFSWNRDITLIPVWSREYTITYFDGIDYLGIGIKYSDESIAIEDISIEKEGYNFVCWKASTRNEYYFPGETYTKNESICLKAVWSAIDNATVVYDTDGASGDFEAQEVEVGGIVTVPLEIPEKDGYAFECWSDEMRAEAQTYSLARTISQTNYYLPGEQFALYQSKRLIPIWMPEERYTITYLDFNGNKMSVQTKFENASIRLLDTVPTATGYEFICWIDDSTGKMYYPGDLFIKDADTTLVSKWRAISNDLIGISIERTPKGNMLYCETDFRIIANPIPFNIAVSMKWKSSNEAVATVDKNGVVSAHSVGKTVITVTATHAKSGAEYTADIPIEVFSANVEKIIENIKNCSTAIIPESRKDAAIATAETMLLAEYEPAFVAGMIANIVFEGATGEFESSNYSNLSNKPDYLSYMDTKYNGENYYLNHYSGKTIMELDVLEVHDMLCKLKSSSNDTWRIDGSRVGFGLGSIQWSFGRTFDLVNEYMKVNGNTRTITKEQAIQAESTMILKELQSPMYSNIVTNWENCCSDLASLNAANTAGALICEKYLVPYQTHIQIQKRAPRAEQIYENMMKGI